MSLRPRKRRRILAPLVHATRVALVAGLLWAIPSPVINSVTDGSVAPTIDDLVLPDDRIAQGNVDPQADSSGMWKIIDGDGQTLAMVARTLPAAADVVGYRGPTEASIVLTPELTIASVGILSSADTEEHVRAVAEDASFFEQFRNWQWGDPPDDVRIDAVSGATLTSLALAEGVLARIGGTRPSLVFPNALQIDEVTPWFEDAAAVDDVTGVVSDRNDRLVGRVLRTGPLSDDVIGYQGPTELLLKLTPEDRIAELKIRGSFDNEPYVGYVRTERGFWKIFRDMTVTELAQFDPEAERVEGVSGATMTSQTIADTLVAAAQAELDRRSKANAESENRNPLADIRLTPADLGTLGILCLLGAMSRSKRFHHGAFRRGWLIGVVVVIGFWSGNLVSMALISGWSAEGIAWKLAPALATIAAVTLLIPAISKQNPYCSHLCPHGALQQLVLPKPQSKRRMQLPRRMTHGLRYLPGATLVVAYISLVIFPSIDLSSWEPFHAYLFRVAPWASIALAAGTLLIATRVPMAYCRYGCPTGRLIEHLRRTALSDQVQTADFTAFALLVFAVSWNRFV